MSDQLRLLPAFVMLVAGAATSIITFLVGYSPKSALLILLVVLIVFYILGLTLQKLIHKFEVANRPKPEEEKKDEEEEGTVVEKDDSEINKNADKSGTEAGNRPQVERPES